ncbi:Trm5 RNA methyltransferase [Cryptosporidium canis]|uniref:tRNA (guanine(37)-N1)-methyltransferase n=1 Tax=Cryptosporidium canis TaxID=195482 RepID=A0ABQ8P2R6_9CRYT|nr:Trm5 RNA methyltransferase [Cryptosporidium canis]
MEEESRELLRGFDTSRIFRSCSLPFVRVDRRHCNYVQSLFREHDILFKFPRVSPVVSDDKSEGSRVILMGEGLRRSYGSCNGKRMRMEASGSDGYIIELSDDYYMRVPEGVFAGLNAVDIAEYGVMDFRIEYKYLSYVECARHCIPKGIEIVSSFETVGHIAHLNLNEESFKYRYVLGRILLDKNPGIRTVVTKTGNIESTFRTYPLEVIAGENDLDARLKEQGIIYHIKIDQVYWNSRLSNERQRLVELIPKKSVVFDLTCGVGAFTLPLVKIRDCRVYSNDLNPEAIKLLRHNILSNKLNERNVVTSQKDCIECIHQVLDAGLDARRIFGLEEEDASPAPELDSKDTFYWICNLPELSLNMLRGFVAHKQAYLDRKAGDVPRFKRTKNHFFFYCFSKDADPMTDIKTRIFGFLEAGDADSEREYFSPYGLSIHEVRDVSPNKKMYCSQFSMDIPVLPDMASL